jgi:hypothetical protein
MNAYDPLLRLLGWEVKLERVTKYFDCRQLLPLAQQTTRKTLLLQKSDRSNHFRRGRFVGVDDGLGVSLPVLLEVAGDHVVVLPYFGVLGHYPVEFRFGDLQDVTYWVK